MIIPSAVVLGVTMFALSQVQSREMLLFLAVAYGLANGALLPGLQALTLGSVDMSARTEATASIFNSFDLGIGVGSTLMGIVALRVGSYSAIYVAAAFIAAVLLGVYTVRYTLRR